MPKENEVVKELEDIEEEDDFFEKLLKEDIDPTKDPDKEPDSKTEKDDPEPKVEEKNEETVESLKAKIAEMERERKGQLDSVVKSRQERAQFKSELSALQNAVADLLEQRSAAVKDALKDEEEKKVPLQDPKAEVRFDENGDKAFVDLTDVKDAIANETKATRAELEELKEQRAIEVAQEAFRTNVQSVIDENKDVYREAYGKSMELYKQLNDKIIELQQRTGEHGENGVLTQDRALELFAGSPEEKAFLEEHPGIDPTRVARVLNTKVDLKIGLQHVADTFKIGVKEDDPIAKLDDKAKAAKEKPGGLAAHGNRDSSDSGDLIQRIANLANEEIEDLNDAEVAKIEAMLLREELKSN